MKILKNPHKKFLPLLFFYLIFMKKLYIFFSLLLGISLLYAQDGSKKCYFNNETAIFFLAPKIEGNPFQGAIFLYTSCEPIKQEGVEVPLYQFISDYDLSIFHSKDTLVNLYINGNPYTGIAQFSDSPDSWKEMYWYQFKEGKLEAADTIKAAINTLPPINPTLEAKEATITPPSINSNDIKPISTEIRNIEVKKPALYLYPTKKQEITVKITLQNSIIIHPYPAYQNGWEVIASPDGNLINKKTGKSHYCLFWETEGTPFMQTIPTGFVVKGEETATFLEEKLAELGLNEKEANEFIIFWLPQMEGNVYNLIHFAQKEYEAVSELNIQPKPETLIRVMMIWQPLPYKKEILPQILPTKPIRKGFTAVEWGGVMLESAH